MYQDLPHTYSDHSAYPDHIDDTGHLKGSTYICTSSILVASTKKEEQDNEETNDPMPEHNTDGVGVTMENTNECNNERVNEGLDFPNLSEQEILRKLQDAQVTKQFNVINSLGEINLANLQKLEQLDRTDPAVKRILMRARLTAREVKEANIDEDIKATVNEFLGTNVTGHFIMARILRENYGAFYSWLTAHIQVERNAWASRFKQALEKMDMQRRENLEIKNLMVESIKIIQHLIMSCTRAMFGTRSRDVKERTNQTSETTTQCFPADNSVFSQARLHGPGISSVFNDEEHVQENKLSFNKMLYAMDILNEITGEGDHLSNSNCDQENQIAPSISTENSNSDPDICSLLDKSYIQHSNMDTSRRQENSKNLFVTSNDFIQDINRQGKAATVIEPGAEELRNTGSNHTASDKDVIPTCNKEASDIGQIMRHCLELLSELCEKMVNDRLSLLRLAGLNPEDCASLVEAVSTCIHDRHNSGHNNTKNAEKRLDVLETENRKLQNEVNELKSMLDQKSNEALNLQHQFETLEALLNDSASDKSHRSIGLEYSAINGSQIARSTSKMCNSIEKNSSCLSNKKITTKSYFSETKTHDAKDVHLIVPHSIKLTPEDRVRFHKAKHSKSTKLNSLFTSSEINSTSSSEQLVKERPNRMHKRLKLRQSEDPLHETPTREDIINIIKVEEHESCNCQIRGNSQTKDPSSHIKILKPMNTNPNHLRLWQHCPCSVYGTAKLKPVLNNGGINRRHSEDKIEHMKDTSIHLSSEVHSKSCPCDGLSVSTATHIAETRNANPSKLPQCTHHEDDGTTDQDIHLELQLNNKNAVINIMNKGEPKDHIPETNHLHNGIRKANTKRDLQKHVMSLISSQTKETKPVLSKVRQNGKNLVNKCLRCQKLFNWADNHNLACSFHRESMNHVQQYDQSGKLVELLNQWTCCLQPEDSVGCCYGQHI